MFNRSLCAKALRLGLALGLGSTAACRSKVQALENRAKVELKPCRIGRLRGTQKCFSLSRPRDPKDPSAGDIPIAVTVIESWGVKQSSAPPLFLLAGGPGQSARSTFGRMQPLVSAWSKTRDIVLVDIRGTGDSDQIPCKLPPQQDYTLSLEESIALEKGKLQACLAGMGPRRPHHYFTPVLADDLDAVRSALGYESISLYGGSYGTRLAMEYARRHDAHTHALVLDGVAPVQLGLPWHFAETFSASWNKITDYCEQDEVCKRRFPNMRSSLQRLKEKLQTPSHRKIRLSHPSRDLEVDVSFDPRTVPLLFFPASYSPLLWTMMPLAVDKALQGQWKATMALSDQGNTLNIDPLVLHFIACNEDKTQWEQKDRKALQASLLGDALVTQYEAICPLFHSEHPLPASYFEPITSDKPTLFMSGEADPVTPASWADKVRKGFPNSLALTIPYTGHNTVTTRCVQNIVNDFLDAKAPLSIETSCIQDTPPPYFFTSVNGPSEHFEAAQLLSKREVHP